MAARGEDLHAVGSWGRGYCHGHEELAEDGRGGKPGRRVRREAVVGVAAVGSRGGGGRDGGARRGVGLEDG